MPVSMQYSYSELYNRVSKYLGTYGSSGPDTDGTTEAKEFVKSGYLRFLTAYDWTFRRRYASLSFESGVYEYDLPQDFGGLRTPFQFTAQTGYPPMEERAEAEIMELRGYGENSSYPQYYAVRSGKYAPETGQVYEIIVWPTPDSTYTAYYSYYYMPPMMSNDNDVPMGGAEHSEAILKYCLMVAEEEGDEQPGPQAAAAQTLLADSIRIDKRREPSRLGPMTEMGSYSPWEIARGSTRVNNVTYDT
jgi:hypothetical protein